MTDRKCVSSGSFPAPGAAVICEGVVPVAAALSGVLRFGSGRGQRGWSRLMPLSSDMSWRHLSNIVSWGDHATLRGRQGTCEPIREDRRAAGSRERTPSSSMPASVFRLLFRRVGARGQRQSARWPAWGAHSLQPMGLHLSGVQKPGRTGRAHSSPCNRRCFLN